jgi:hypothetical protein
MNNELDVLLKLVPLQVKLFDRADRALSEVETGISSGPVGVVFV